MFETKNYVTPKTILVAPELAFSLPAVFANTGVDADADGKKILKAGQPVSGDFTDRNTAFVKTAGAGANAIVLHDVDVTKGNANGTILISGFVDQSKLDVEITEEDKAALTKITFVK